MFRTRTEAGDRLADRIEFLKSWVDPIVIAIPRGGVPVAAPVAKRMRAPLEVLVVRKIGAPGNPEYGIGAITETGFYWINDQATNGINEARIGEIVKAEFLEVQRRVRRYRQGQALPDVVGRSVIVVDDGFATGITAAVAARYLKRQGAREVILAAPVGAKESVEFLKSQADQVICLETPPDFYSVGEWYELFDQLSDEDVTEILQRESKPFSRELEIPPNAKGLILFAHGNGSSRFSTRNRKVASLLRAAGFGTLLFDLLSEGEAQDRDRVFEIPLLADRLLIATEWVRRELAGRGPLPIGYFGASTGAAAALWAAAEQGPGISAVVSRGGRPDLAFTRLQQVEAPTLLIVGGEDHPVIEMNELALSILKVGRLKIIPGATHLFEEPGALEEVARLAIDWFQHYLGSVRKVA